ncbi:uncharacterized protein LOC110806468 [Carica papaya]|uniref:uncharacterized protein LOC110806468 n=1 Tax=Carica papaya TaxID=3649 RepID=UPI000B8C6E16|nr:uncharacterized protein LOC110806468 [Carica papaya]
MTHAPSFPLLLFSSLAILLAIARADERAPHGLVYESPMAFSPAAFDFFHPNRTEPAAKKPGDETDRSWPQAAKVDATKAQEVTKTLPASKGGGRVSTGGIAGIVFGLAVLVLLSMGVYYVLVARRTNMGRANTVKPDV